MIDISTSSSVEVSEKTMDLCRVLSDKILHDFGKEDASVSLYFTNNEEIHAMNRDYRGKDYATDVLSFRLEDAYDSTLGEIIISIETAEKQRDARTIDGECRVLFVHGMLHLLGYDHETEDDYAIMHEIELRYVPDA